jgi:beta-lactamase regulating signal transducer with metallopeptidase domain
MTWLADTLIVTGLLIAAVLLLRRPVTRAFGVQTAYALWLVPLLRLLLPPLSLPASWAPVEAASNEQQTYVIVADAVATPVAAAPVWTCFEVLSVVWLAGCLAFIVWRTVTYFAMRRSLLADAQCVGEVGKVRLVESPAVTAPVAFGVLDKVVALPLGFMAWPDAKARDLALAHELAHHAGHDLLINIAAQPLLALHWFNPLAWAGWRAMRRDQEAACDARVLAGQGGEVRADYGRLIASLAGGPRLALAAPMAGFRDFGPVLGEKSIIHRLRSLTMPEMTVRRRRIGLGLIASAALALPLTATIGYAAPEAVPAAPTPPEMPAAPAAPDGKHVEKRVMIIHHADGAHDPAKMKTRTITRDGKTVTITTDEDLTDEQLDAKLAELEKGGTMVMMRHEGPVPPEAPGAPHREIRRIIINSSDGKANHEAMAMANGAMPHGGAIVCSDKDGAATVVTNEGAGDGKSRMVKVKICSMAHAEKSALSGLKSARERLANDPKLPANVRDDVLKSLDEEIAKLSKAG